MTKKAEDITEIANKRPYAKKYFAAQAAIFKLLIFFTPLIFVINTNEIFEFPKMYFVYLLGGTAIWLFAVKRSLNMEGFKGVKWPGWPINLFVAAYAVSTILSSHTYTSLWGYYTRFNGGLMSVLIFYGIYVVLINEFDSYQIRQLTNFALNAAAVSAAYGVLQHFEIAADVWRGNPAERVFSTLGQPNWYAAFLAMISPTLLGHMFDVFEKHEKQDGLAKIMWWGAYVLVFMALWFTYSVSGLLGFAVGTLFFFSLHRKIIIEKLDGVVVLLVITIAIATFNMGIFDDKIQDIFTDMKKLYLPFFDGGIGGRVVYEANAAESIVPTGVAPEETFDTQEKLRDTPQKIQTVQDLENLVSDPGFIRTGLWKGTWKMYLASPKTMIIGNGPETFAYEFQEFRPKDLNYSSEWDFVFNKPHNYYLELLVNIGAVGLLLYMIVALKSVATMDKYFTPGLVAFFVVNIFSWPTVTTALLFWLFLAGIEKNK